MKIPHLLAIACAIGLAAGSVNATTAAKEHPGALPLLVGIESVRNSLKLDSLQRAVLDSIRDEYKTEAKKLFKPAPATPEAKKETLAKLDALTERFNARVLAALNPTQKKKLESAEAEVLGATILVSPKVQKELGLNAAQSKKIEALRQKGLGYVDKVNKQFEEGEIGYFEKLELLRSKRLSLNKAMLGVLTPDQQKAFTALSNS